MTGLKNLLVNEMQNVVSGYSNGRRWIAGHIPMKQNVVLYVDTRDSTGVKQILDFLADFIRYQAVHMALPYHSTEDIIQELNVIAITAIPDYDVGKGANMLTFLQNHLKNRIINIYKHATEKCRTAIHENFRFCKVKCPNCKQYTIIDECAVDLKYCYSCGHKRAEGEVWRSYPVPIASISANEEFMLQDGSQTTIQDHCSYDDTLVLTGGNEAESESAVLRRLSINNIISTLDEETKNIVKLFLYGHSILEIARRVKMSAPYVKAKISALADNNGFKELHL